MFLSERNSGRAKRGFLNRKLENLSKATVLIIKGTVRSRYDYLQIANGFFSVNHLTSYRGPGREIKCLKEI